MLLVITWLFNFVRVAEGTSSYLLFYIRYISSIVCLVGWIESRKDGES